MIAYCKTTTIERFAKIKGCSKANIYSNLYKFILLKDEDNNFVKPYRVVMTEEAKLWNPGKRKVER